MNAPSPLGPDLVALVTGASSGIGEATVRALRAHDVRVYAAARRVERLEALASGSGAMPRSLDVRDRAAVAELADLEIDVLVNNAGLGRSLGSIWTSSDDDVERTIDTNVTGAINVVRAVLPGMIERGRGHIVNVGSVLGLRAGTAALYSATKGAIRRLSEDLRLELAGTGVRVTEVCPGRVETEFYDVAVDDVAVREAAKATGTTNLTSEDIAASIVHVIGAPWHVNVTTMEILPTEQTYGGANFAAGP